MGRGKNLTLQIQNLIVKEIEKGKSQRQVAAQFGVSKSGVAGVLKRYKERNAIFNSKIPGRPRKTSEKQDRIITRLSKEDPRKSASEIRAEILEKYQISCSVSTVKRRLRTHGLFGRRPLKKPLVSVKNRKARILFAKTHLHWTSKDWRKVLWSDESKFMMFGSDGIKYIRRPVGQRINPKYQLPTVKHGGGNIMVWGCFSRDIIGPLYRIDGVMDQTLYKNIITNVMLPHAKEKMPRGWIFQQDNDPKHTAKTVKNAFTAKKIRVLEWPSQSPDLNPIEHLWEHLDRQVSGRKPKNKDELFSLLESAWKEISIDVLINLVDSMPDRCKAVLKSKGY